MPERQGDFHESDDQQYDNGNEQFGVNSDSDKNLFESILNETREDLGKESVFPKLVEFVRSQRLTSTFCFENLEELVRFVIESSQVNKLEFDRESCIEFVASCLYDDPSCRLNCENLWRAIISRISTPN